MQNDEWSQYESKKPTAAPSGDEWSQYEAKPSAPAPLSGPISASPVPQGLMGPPTPEENNKVALSEGLKGMAKGGAQTVADYGSLVHKLPVVGELAAPQKEIDYYSQKAQAHNPDQQAGKLAEAGIEMAMPMVGGMEALPDAKRAGRAIGAVEDAMESGGHMVPLRNSVPSLQNYNDLRATGAPSVSGADALYARSQAAGNVPLPFKQARNFYSNMGTSMAEKMSMKGKMAQAAPALQKSLGSDITEAANAAGTNASGMGYGDELSRAMREYGNAKSISAAGKGLLKAAGLGGGIAGAGYGLYEKAKGLLR